MLICLPPHDPCGLGIFSCRAQFEPVLGAKTVRLARESLQRRGRIQANVGHIVVDGGIAGEKILTGAPKLVEQRGMDGLISLEGLTDAYWYLHNQSPRAWTFEVDLRTSREPW